MDVTDAPTATAPTAPRSRLGRWFFDVSLGIGVYAGLVLLTSPVGVAALMGLPKFPWANRIGDLGGFVAFVAATILAFRLGVRVWRRIATALRAARERTFRLGEAGSITVEFVLIFPILYFLFGIILQMALIANSSLVVRYAAYAAARTAIVNLDYQGVTSLTQTVGNQDEAREAAHLVLAAVSPDVQTPDDPLAVPIRDILQSQTTAQNQVNWGAPSLPRRMNYAQAATTISFLAQAPRTVFNTNPNEIVPPAWSGPLGLSLPNLQIPIPGFLQGVLNFVQNASGRPFEVEVTVTYLEQCVVPGIPQWTGFTTPVPALPGIGGSAFPITRIVRLQSAGGRRAGLGTLAGIFLAGLRPW